MEVNRIKQMQRLRASIPDMQKTLETVKFLESKQALPVFFVIDVYRTRRTRLKHDLSSMTLYLQQHLSRLRMLSIYGLEYISVSNALNRRQM